MKSRMFATIVGAALLVVPAIAGFATGTSEKSAAPTLKVALIVDQKRGDQGVIDETVAGVQKAAHEIKGVKIQIVEALNPSQDPDTFRAMTGDWGANVIITVFQGLVKPALASAAQNPKVKYVLIFGTVKNPPPNVMPVRYIDAQAYYISGMMAAMRTKTGKVAFDAGLDIPTAREAYAAFVKGAKSIRPNIQTLFAVVGSFQDPAKGKELALSLMAQGYDVFCGWASKSDWGVAEACHETGKCSVDGLSGVVDLRPKYGKAIIGQAGVNFAITAFQVISDLSKGIWHGGKLVTRSMATGDVGLQWIPTTRDGYTQAQISKILNVQQEIKTGTLKVD